MPEGTTTSAVDVGAAADADDDDIVAAAFTDDDDDAATETATAPTSATATKQLQVHLGKTYVHYSFQHVSAKNMFLHSTSTAANPLTFFKDGFDSTRPHLNSQQII